MQVKVVLFGILRERFAREKHGHLTVELGEGNTIADLCTHLGFNNQVIFSVNGEVERDFEKELNDGDVVHFFQSIGGG